MAHDWGSLSDADLMSMGIQLLVSMDRMVGDDFTASHASLKALAEAKWGRAGGCSYFVTPPIHAAQ